MAKEIAGVEGANKNGAATAAMLKVGDRFVIRVGAGCTPSGRGPWDRSGGVRGEGIQLGLSPKRGRLWRWRVHPLSRSLLNVLVAQYHVGPIGELHEGGQFAALEGTMSWVGEEARHGIAAVASEERNANIRVWIEKPVVGMRCRGKRGANGDCVIVCSGIVAAHVGVEVAWAVHRGWARQRQHGRDDGGR